MFHVIWGGEPRLEGRLSHDLHLTQTGEGHVFFDLLGVDTQPKVICEELKSAFLYILEFVLILVSYRQPK